MGVELKRNKIVISKDTEILDINKKVIEQLNSDECFIHKYTNKIGRELVAYLCNRLYHTISNSEPVNLKQNTLAKVFNYLKVIDREIKKPLDKYTPKIMNIFMAKFAEGKIKGKGRSKKTRHPSTMGRYILEFRRFWKIHRQYNLIHYPNKFNQLDYEWGQNIKADISDNNIDDDYPFLRVDQLIELAKNLYNEEYNVRTLLAINLMARKCEMSELRRKHIEIRSKSSIWIKLPKVKKHSTKKVSVELYTFAKKSLLHYLDHNKFESEDRLFPTDDQAYAKNLQLTAKKLFKENVTPKTLRKIGVCVAEQMGYSRADVERIGGWAANSPIVKHYFHRSKGVAVIKDSDKKIDESLYADIHAEFDKVKIENQSLQRQMDDLKRMVIEMREEKLGKVLKS